MASPVDFKRIIKGGFLHFQRNPWLSTASIIMMSLVLLVVGGLFMMQAMAEEVFTSFSDKIDISIYIKTDTPEAEIFKVRDDLQKMSEVRDVSYISQNQALASFRETHKGNALILDSLAELDKNPLQASLNIRAKETGQFEHISEYISSKNYSFIDKINFYENRAIIERLGAISGGVRSGGLLIAIIFAAISVIIAFNTIRIAIYSHREQIRIMTLVGASHWYIRGPFIVEGILHGLISSLVALAILFPAAWVASPRIAGLIPGFDIFQYFKDNIFLLFAVMLAVSMSLGIFSSMIAMRKYLKEL